ncbi:hypothetical protein IFM89_032023 [Coptis chinensis]|uniref:RRM domain-containing protein n=1 Tax=Coptis chinensis TaxID=261450 RepID=A0A835LD79_9MAGN|nr:hypothetical protein IFM89_032023 [Coptis chinensis]
MTNEGSGTPDREYNEGAQGSIEENTTNTNNINEMEEKFHPHTGDGASPGKIFIGGLAKETTPVQFNKHFGKYGEITDSVIMKDRKSGQPRGFGFVTYADPSVVDKVIEDTHVINGKQVEIKRTIPKGSVTSRDIKTKKIFVGGIPTTVTEDELKEFFAKFGEVKEHMIMRDHATSRSRGFGFITFETEQSVDGLLSKGNKIEMAGAQVEIKKAEPKKANPPPPPSKRFNDSRPSYGGGFGDSYGGYGATGAGGYGATGAGGYGATGAGGYGATGAGGYGASSYRSGGGRPGAYSGYGGNELGSAYGGYGGSSFGGYNRGETSLGYSSRYGGSYGRGYDLGSAYGGGAEGYGGYGSGAAGGYGSSYDTGLGSGYGGGTGSSFYGNRGGYGGGGSGRYHPYGR